ncbi:MAG: hypothetical protein ACPIOQ_84415, partial [Promethearchaeia archaeon]
MTPLAVRLLLRVGREREDERHLMGFLASAIPLAKVQGLARPQGMVLSGRDLVLLGCLSGYAPMVGPQYAAFMQYCMGPDEFFQLSSGNAAAYRCRICKTHIMPLQLRDYDVCNVCPSCITIHGCAVWSGKKMTGDDIAKVKSHSHDQVHRIGPCGLCDKSRCVIV